MDGMYTDMKGMIRRAFSINADAHSAIRHSPCFLTAVTALLGVLAAFSAGAQSYGTVRWWAGNGYAPGPYSSPNAACAILWDGLAGPAGDFGPNAYYLDSNAVADPAGWQGTPIGGYPGSHTYCNYTQTTYACGTSCPYVLQVMESVPYLSAVLPAAGPVSPKDVGCPCRDANALAGDPIALSIGNKFRTVTDYQAPGPNALQFVRVYNSAPIAGVAANFATGWMHNYATSVSTISATAVAVTRPDGKVFTFNLVSGTWTSDADVNDKLVQLLSGSTVIGWQYTNAANDSLEAYDAYGNLSSIAYREGTTVTMTYATGSGAPTFPGQLLSVTDSFGKSLMFGYVNNILYTMTDPNGSVYTYSLGSRSAVLSSVTYPDTFSESYLYNESAYTAGTSLPSALTGVIDENNSRYDTTWYNTSGTAIQTALAGGVGQYSMTNTLDGTDRIQSVALVDPLGATRGRTFVSSVGRNRLSTVTQPAASGSPAGSYSLSYDANGNISESTDLNGNVQCFVFDLTRNLETGRVEGTAPGNTCPTSISTYVPAAGTAQRKILTQWHSIWHLPAQRAEPLKITTWVYNGDGGVYCAPTIAKVGINPIGVVCSRSEQATTDATGGSGFSATASGAPRVWAYTYNSFGQVLTAKGPRTDVNSTTTYTYYTCTTGYQCGQIESIQDAVGHTTTFNTYNAHGQPLTITDPNGVVTTMTYDARLRLTSRQVGTETTSYSYYPTGLLKTVTRPDSSAVTHTYDAAHRLTTVTDGAANYINYTLDNMGNHTAVNTYDPSNTLHLTHTQVFNTLSELYQDVNAAGTSAVTTTYGYDSNGNQTSISAPLARNTSNQYDALNRLVQITDPNSGVTQLGYDAKDNLASVIDPRTLTTGYSHNGFGDVTQQVSRDTGTTTNAYDSGGNLHTATDARGALAMYSYDALNRVTQAAYSDQTINFTYDSGANGIGRLTGASDANHALAWSYDTLGRVVGKGLTVGSVNLSVGYSYVNGDLTTMVTPSGQTITYGYANHQITSVSVNGAAIVTGATHEPFGNVNGWKWGNSTSVSRTYDTDEKITQINTAADTILFGYDNAFRISGITDTGISANTWTLGYDVLDRLTSAAETATTLGWTYDANGNRLSQTGTNPSTFAPSATSNLLNSIMGALARTYAYDAAGNTTGYSSDSFFYNQRGRMTSATVGSSSTNYIYSALGQMIEKSGPGGSTYLMYDEAGHLLGEYSSGGALIEETVWMGDTPVATLQPNGGTVSTYYVHTDQLNAPRVVTRPADNAIEWRWDTDPFGTVAANTNPAGLGTFIYNLRFQGQYYQAETGLYLNYFRDYDPQTGRYIESDPIGLQGGSFSTYAYANGDPIFFVDPFGLCWVYSQSKGQLTYVDSDGNVDYTANGGYSGYGTGYQNNPAMQNVQAQQHGDPAGPIPQGVYSIGPLHDSANTGPDVMNLSPLPGTNTFNRKDFEIHGERKHGPPGHASSGCIIEPPNVRHKIANSNDNCLRVVP
jgi:RHS repeat-associated protein